MTKSSQLLSIFEQGFEYRQLDDILNTIKELEPGEYDITGVEAVLTTSKDKAKIDDIQSFITRYHKVCFIYLEDYAPGAKSLILLSDEPKKISEAKSFKDTGAVVYKNRLFAYNLGK